MRISTISIMNNYNRNLNTTMVNLDSSRMKVLTQRKFNYGYEDPGAAARSFKLRRQFNYTADYIENVESTISLFDTVSGSTLNISKLINQNINEDVLRGINGATSKEAKETYAKTIKSAQENIILNLNTQYSDRFLFGGESTKEPPFKLEDDGRITFRGIDLNTENPDELRRLEEMMGEKLYVDLGFGIETNNNSPDGSTLFDTAVSGLSIVGFGKTEDGRPKGLLNILGDMSSELQREPFDEDKFRGLLDVFNGVKNDVADFAATLGSRCEFLDATKERLTTSSDNLNIQILGTENVDMAEAITGYVWQQYAYNSALKVGTNILTQSLIDFMR